MADLKISQFADGGTVQTGDQIAAVRGVTNTRVSVGSAATFDAGSDIGELLIIEDVGGNPALPAIDGSQLTGVASGGSKVTISDANGGYLDDKLQPGTLITTEIETDSSGDQTLVFDVRSQIATPATVSSGTHTVDIANGDFHEVTATGIFTFAWSMNNGQSVLVRGIDFDANTPIDGLDWGDAGTPEWTGKDDFVVYRDNDGNYIGALIVSGLA